MALKHEVDQRAKLENNYCEQLFSQLKPLPVRLIQFYIYSNLVNYLFLILLFQHKISIDN